MTVTLKTIKEDLPLHSEWVHSNGTKGQKFDAFGSDLPNADLPNADLRNADLRNADLRWANLRGADLRNADLRKADLSHADLSHADLSGTDLRWAMGNGKEVISSRAGKYHVVYTSQVLSIGCQAHPIADWWAFTDEEITVMSSDALEWWRAHKDSVRSMIEANPAAAGN